MVFVTILRLRLPDTGVVVHGVVMALSWACFYITRGKMFTAQQAAVPELMQLLSAYQCMISWYELSIPTSGCN